MLHKEKSFGYRFIKGENYQSNSRQGQEALKGYKGVLFFEEEDENDRNRLIRHPARGPYDDDDEDEEDDDIETGDFYPDNDDYNVETYKRPSRKRSLYK